MYSHRSLIFRFGCYLLFQLSTSQAGVGEVSYSFKSLKVNPTRSWISRYELKYGHPRILDAGVVINRCKICGDCEDGPLMAAFAESNGRGCHLYRTRCSLPRQACEEDMAVLCQSTVIGGGVGTFLAQAIIDMIENKTEERGH